MHNDVTIVIPQFSRIDLTIRCCESIRNAERSQPQLLIVDDGSHPDELSDTLPSLSELGDLLPLPHRGVTAAWNAGAQTAESRWLIFLNNDTCSLGEWCDQLLAPLRTGAAVMAGVGWRSERHLPAALDARWKHHRWLPGWCFAIERSRLLDLGGFDEAMWLYFSDTDLQVRLRCEDHTGDPLMSVEGLPLLHDAHSTAHQCDGVRELWRKDRREFHRKWRSGHAGPAFTTLRDTEFADASAAGL